MRPADRAAATEKAVLSRSVRRLWCLPGTRLGVNSWPPTAAHRLFLGWNYWWQAHLLDCIVDAALRDPEPAASARRRRLAERLARGIRIANGLRWTNAYYDDMAWLALALQRSDRHLGTDHGAPIAALAGEITDAWSDLEGGGIPWRRGDEFKNAPANGPAAILLARTGAVPRAADTADWLDRRLRDPGSGLIWDGLRPGPGGTTRFETTIYTYNQGVVLGAETELALRRPESRAESVRRVARLVAAVRQNLSHDDVLTGHSGADSGLFSGILARYLAMVALRLPGEDAAAVQARQSARTLVFTSADAAWDHALSDGSTIAGRQESGPIFGPDWSRPAVSPTTGHPPERDLSVQLSGWMLMEAAAALDHSGNPDVGGRPVG